MKHIDENQLETDVHARYAFVAGFVGFSKEDAVAIHSIAGKLAPRIPALVEQTYERLLEYDATARHFVPRQHGYDGALPSTVEELTSADPQIQFRKDHLNRYLMSLLGRAYDEKMTTYLDMVGKMHTPKAGSQLINVPLVQMNALMGLLSDILIREVAALDLETEQSFKVIRSLNKLLWIQNDLINRHYQAE